MRRTVIRMNGRPIAEVGLADRFFLRLRGLIGRDPEALGGLYIKPCGQIHTFFMSVPIDVVYLDRNGAVLQVEGAVPVTVCRPAVRGARRVLELPAGRAAQYGITVGAVLETDTKLQA